jgi:hypothetical protein
VNGGASYRAHVMVATQCEPDKSKGRFTRQGEAASISKTVFDQSAADYRLPATFG